MGSTDEEILKIEEKARENKEEDDEEEYEENNDDSEDESSDSGEENRDNNSGENNTDNWSKNCDVSMVEEIEGNSGKVVNGEWKKFRIRGRQRIIVRTKTTRTKITTRV